MTASDRGIPMDLSDLTKQLARPHRLYGRETAAASLMESFDRICRGLGEVVLVPGYSGVGKTALVQEIRKPVRDRNGFFLQGKFNQYQQNIPYFAIRQALAELARELQFEDEPLREQWQSALRQAVGGLGRLLVDLVPEFDSLLGPQPTVAEISPLEARHRFAGVLRNFFAAVCRPEHPVVLFIDDWQWADTASFELLKQFQIGTTLRYLLVIVPYRDNEVDRAHPLVATMEELRRQSVPVSVIKVRDLGEEDVLAWAKDLLQPKVENPEALAKFIHGRTKGNPFFTQASLAFLHDFGLLHFDRGSECWRWKMESEGIGGLPGDVVEIFRLRLIRLDQGSRDLLIQAACLGNHFDLGSLAVISRRRPGECRSLLLAIREMVIPVGDDDSGGDPAGDEASQEFMFIHDRVQQAAYGLIPPEHLPSVRLEIGRQLLVCLGREQLAERLFEVADHLNIGQLLIEDTAEQVQAVELNVAAARKARAATAYRAALQFHRAAGRFLTAPAFAEHLWNKRHDLALSLFQEWAESEFLEGDLTAAEHCIDQSVLHARTPTEKAGALNILIVQNTLLARYPEAIAAGRQALAVLGIILPEKGYELVCDAEIGLVRRGLVSRSVASLAELPVMSDPEMRMAAKILIAMGPPCYRSHQRLWGVIVPKVVNLTLRYGNIEQVGYSHPAFAGLLCWVANDFSLAREFGELATRLMTEVFHSPSDRSVYALMIGSSVRHWFHHLKRGSEDYAEACEIGLQSGNLQYTAYAFGHNMYCRFYQGVALGDLIEESRRSLVFSRTRLNQWAIDLLEGGVRIFSSLYGSEAEDGGRESMPEADYMAEVEAHGNIQVTCIYKILKTFSLLLLGRYDDALEMSDQVEPILYTVGMQGLLPWPEHRFARLLILTALTPGAEQRRQAEWRIELAGIIDYLRLWADQCPENFEYQYHLAAAELARVDSRYTEAMGLYEQAIDGARAGGFVQWEGMANERAARFLQERDKGRLAQVYWQQAYICFERWGAKVKLQAMEKEYRQWLAVDLTQLPDTAGVQMAPADNALLEKQVQLLRSQALQSLEAHMQGEVERLAEEQIRAAELLRLEVAERKRVEEALRLHREQLEERVKERTAALEKSLVELKLAEESMRHLNRELRAISDCNQALMRAVDEQTLFNDICHIICDEAGYCMVWVGYADNDEAKTIRPVAWAGVEDGYLEQASLTWADTARGRGPSGTAIRTGESACIQDFATDSHAAPWREHALQRGYRSSISLPLKDENANTFGVINIYSTQANAFNPDEVRLLEELAGDLAFGITVLRARIERKRVEDELRHYKDQLEETVQQRTAELLLACDAAEAANKAKSVFLANMSHELRTPLNAILGFSNMMRRDPQVTGSQRDNLNIINRSGEHLLTLINDVLEMAKIEAGRLQLEIAPFDLGGMVRDVAEMMQIRAQEKGLQLLLDQSSEFPRYIKGDEARLRQALINLVGNAVKFTEQGGVTIRLGVKRNDRQHLLIEVEDSGPGIGPEHRKRLFEPFVQMAESAVQHGTGLGLAIARQFVQLMGGDIAVESTLGKGALFRIELPVESAGATDILKPEVEKCGDVVGVMPGQPCYRILIAEDQHENRLLLSRLMAEIGVETKVAETGEQCVKLFQEWRPDLIWMDRRMPVMDGEEATRRIRRLPGGEAVKIVAVTASAFKEQQQEMLDAGMDDFVRKPYRFDEIYESMARQLGIKYLYRSDVPADEAEPVVLTSEMLAVLPASLRQEFREALESLDSQRIIPIILRIDELDVKLGGALSRLANNFDYPAILKALNEMSSG